MNTIKTIRTMRTLSSMGMLMLLILLVLMNMQQHMSKNTHIPGKDVELKQNQLFLFWHSLLTWVGW